MSMMALETLQILNRIISIFMPSYLVSARKRPIFCKPPARIFGIFNTYDML